MKFNKRLFSAIALLFLIGCSKNITNVNYTFEKNKLLVNKVTDIAENYELGNYTKEHNTTYEIGFETAPNFV